MSAKSPLRFEIEIQTTGPPITGRWWPNGRAPREFVGWTELFAALDAAISGEPEPEGGRAASPPTRSPPT